MIAYWFSVFVQTWNLLLEISFPTLFAEREPEESGTPPSHLLAAFPAVGFVQGLVIAIIAWLFSRMAGGGPAAAVGCALVAPAFLEILNRGKVLGTIAAFAERIAGGESAVEAASSLDDRPETPPGMSGMMTCFSIYVLRMLCIGLLVHFDRTSWIVVALTFGYTIQAWIATREDERGRTFFEIENPERAVYPWIIAVALGMIAGAGYIPFVLLMAVFAYVYAIGFNRFYRSLCGSIDGTAIGVAGYLAETLFLFIGLAALVRG